MCNIYNLHAQAKIRGRKYATYTVFACMYEQEEARVRKIEYMKEREKGKISELRFKGIPTPRVFLFVRVVATGRGGSGD